MLTVTAVFCKDIDHSDVSVRPPRRFFVNSPEAIDEEDREYVGFYQGRNRTMPFDSNGK